MKKIRRKELKIAHKVWNISTGRIKLSFAEIYQEITLQKSRWKVETQLMCFENFQLEVNYKE